jgi:hypothetical protein
LEDEMTTTNWTKTGHRREAERDAAHWSLIRSQLPTDQTRRVPDRLWYRSHWLSGTRDLWHRIRWLSRIRDRKVLRDRLQAYVAW